MVAVMKQPKKKSTGTLVRELVAKLWTMDDVQRLFRRSELTVALWVKNHGLPVVRIPGQSRDSIRFDPTEVKAWAKTNGKTVYETPAVVGESLN
jgi:hypothetical protein